MDVAAASSFDLESAVNARWIRQDTVGWVNETNQGGLAHARCLIRGIFGAIEAYRGDDERPLYHVSTAHRVPTHCQLARYDGAGASYSIHRDSCDKSLWDQGPIAYLLATPERRRCLTAILYLSQGADDWCEEDGGILLLYQGTEKKGASIEDATGVVRVRPQAGSLLVFDSRLLHEVLPTHRKGRTALTSWCQGARDVSDA